jgi:quinol monooxygenase YgiN
MLTIFFHVTVKPGCEEAMHALVLEMTAASRSEGDGCITYRFHRRQDDARQWLLHEQWRDQDALRAHMRHMKQRFGEPPPGARLPERLHVLTERFEGLSYDIVE